MKKVSGSVPWNNLTLSYVAISDVGCRRKVNEDDFLVMPEYRLFCVADGMGGHDAGDVASQVTLESIGNYMDSINPKTDTALPLENSSSLFSSSAFENSIDYANKKVYALADGRMMGSTIVAGQFLSDQVRLGHVGDSRIYKYAQGQLSQVTEDHSLVNDLYKQGLISKQQMGTHPQRNIITRAIGTGPSVDISTCSISLQQRELLLFCSDGLTCMLEDEEISRILESTTDLPVVAQNLVQQANAAGGRDNITVLLVAVQ